MKITNTEKKTVLYSGGIVLSLFGILSFNISIFPFSLYGALVTAVGLYALYMGAQLKDE
jgi:uncharacterized membrane protein